MSKKFYAWKNRGCQGINPEWIELTGKQFAEICNANKALPDEEKRWFYKLPALEKEDDSIILECTKERYLESQANVSFMHREREKEDFFFDNYALESFDFVYTDDSGEEYTLHDIVEDSRVNVEDTAIKNYFTNSLYEAISFLNQEDKEFILYWIEKKKAGLSDDKIADSLNITVDKLRWKNKQVCRELKKILKKN